MKTQRKKIQMSRFTELKSDSESDGELKPDSDNDSE